MNIGVDEYNIYCDESCHLENDHQKAMVLGAIWCPTNRVREISDRIRHIKQKHGIKPEFEIKWTKVSPAKENFYLDIIDYFFLEDDLHFRALIVPDKSILDHPSFNQTHDDWYYKMYFQLLNIIPHPDSFYKIYLDIKDTRSAEKISKLHEVLCNNIYDFFGDTIKRVQMVRSHEIQILQIADLLIGAVSYKNRQLKGSIPKLNLIEKIEEKSGKSLTVTTPKSEEKFNLFVWRPKEMVNSNAT
jgi:hypothetical protein